MKILVAYYSRTGNNRLLAKSCATALTADLFEIKTKDYNGIGEITLDMMFGRKPKLLVPPPDAKDYFLENNPADLEKLTTMVTSTFTDNRNKGEKNYKK